MCECKCEKIKPGDVVRLKSGGPKMTVSAVKTPTEYCPGVKVHFFGSRKYEPRDASVVPYTEESAVCFAEFATEELAKCSCAP